MKYLIFYLLFFSIAHTALPCIWITGTKYNTESVSTLKYSGGYMLRESVQKDRRPDGVKMEADLRGATKFSDRSDYSVALMYLGRNKEAVDLLQQLEKERPGEYFVASNLGTAFELSGNNEEALRWIKEGIRRNPDSHEGSEWLHAKILEAKIAQQKDPAFFEKHSVLELHPANIGEQVTIGEKKLSTKQLAEAIQHQLSERLQFVKPPDPAVASLLFDYAAIEAATNSLESAKSILQMATEYGYPSAKVQPLLKDFDQRIALRIAKETRQSAFHASIILGMIGLLWVLYKRGIFVLTRRDLKPR